MTDDTRRFTTDDTADTDDDQTEDRPERFGQAGTGKTNRLPPMNYDTDTNSDTRTVQPLGKYTPSLFVGGIVLSLGSLFAFPFVAKSFTALIATPVRHPVSAALLLGIVAVVSLWAVARVTVRAAGAIEGGDG